MTSDPLVAGLTADDAGAVQRFVDLVRVDTVSGAGVSSGSYAIICALLSEHCRQAGLSVERHEVVPGKPIVVATWPGTSPDLPSLLLTGHYDVVPVDSDRWSCDPFGGVIRDGFLYGRGTQDMKCCLAAYIECISAWNGP